MKHVFQLFILLLLTGCGGSGGDNSVIDDQPPVVNQPPFSYERLVFVSPFPTVESQILIKGNYFLVANGIGFFEVFNMTNEGLTPIEYSLDGSLNTTATRIAISDNILFVKGFSQDLLRGVLLTYDMTDMENISLLSVFTQINAFGGLIPSGNYLYSGGSFGEGIDILDISDVTNISKIQTVVPPNSGSINEFILDDNDLFAVSGSTLYSYQVLDNGLTLQNNGTLPFENRAWTADFFDDQMFLAIGNNITSINVENPAAPFVSFRDEQFVSNRYSIPIDYHGGFLFVGELNNVIIYKVNSGGTLSRFDEVVTENEVVEIAVDNQKLIVINSPQLEVQPGTDGRGQSSIEIFSVEELYAK